MGSSETFSPLWISHSLYTSLTLSDFLHYCCRGCLYIFFFSFFFWVSLWITLYLQLKKLSSNRHPSISIVQCEGLTLQCYYGHWTKEHCFVYISNSEVIHFCLSCTIAWLTDPQSSYSWHGDYRLIVCWVSTVIVLELSEIYIG